MPMKISSLSCIVQSPCIENVDDDVSKSSDFGVVVDDVVLSDLRNLQDSLKIPIDWTNFTSSCCKEAWGHMVQTMPDPNNHLYSHHGIVLIVVFRDESQLLHYLNRLQKSSSSTTITNLLYQTSKSLAAIFRIIRMISTNPLPRTTQTLCFDNNRIDAIINSYNSFESAIKTYYSNDSILSTTTKPSSPFHFMQQSLIDREDELRKISDGITTFRIQQRKNCSTLLLRQIETISNILVQNSTVGSTAASNTKTIRIVHVSDTHNHHRLLLIPNGDLFIHSGDICGLYHPNTDIVKHFVDFLQWLNDDVCPKFHQVIFIAGNHDIYLDSKLLQSHHPDRVQMYLECQQVLNNFLQCHPNVAYLNDSSIQYDGLTIYGNSYVPCRMELVNKRYLSNGFERTVQERRNIWKNNIPSNIDILVTHCPPHTIGVSKGIDGCPIMTDYVYTNKANTTTTTYPRLHVFGHIHTMAGLYSYATSHKETNTTILMNGSQEALINMDPVAGGVPMIIDLEY